MKKIILILLASPMFIRAQSDTLFQKDGKIIPCTITLDNGLSIFYNTKKSEGNTIERSKLLYFTQNGKRLVADPEATKRETTGNVFINGLNINSLDLSYCEIVVLDRGLSNAKTEVFIDYGQPYSFGESQSVAATAGRPIIFNSMVDALNFMERSGWVYFSQYVSGNLNADKINRILLKRKK